MTRHFLRDDDITPAEQAEILDLAEQLKSDRDLMHIPVVMISAVDELVPDQLDPLDSLVPEDRHR